MLFSLVIFQLSRTPTTCFLGWLCSYHSKRTQFFKLTLWCRKYQPGPKVKCIFCVRFPVYYKFSFFYVSLQFLTAQFICLQFFNLRQPQKLKAGYSLGFFRFMQLVAVFVLPATTEQSHSTSVR